MESLSDYIAETSYKTMSSSVLAKKMENKNSQGGKREEAFDDNEVSLELVIGMGTLRLSSKDRSNV